MAENRPRPRVAIFYSRPFDEPYHGASVHLRTLVRFIGTSLEIVVVTPPSHSSGRYPSIDTGSLSALRFLSFGVLRALWFGWEQRKLPPEERAQVVVGFDVYLAGLAALWAKILRAPFIYLPLDSNKEVSQGFIARKYRGGILRHLIRGWNERIALSMACAIYAPSEEVYRNLKGDAIPEGKLRLLRIKRESPRMDMDAVKRWKEEMGLNVRPGVIFLGSFLYPPNVRAFEFIRAHVAPEFAHSEIAPLFLIAGYGSEAHKSKELENLRVLGTVADLDGLLYACRVALAPLDVQGGTSGKIVDYVLHGLPVVATREAVGGVLHSRLLHVVPKNLFVATIRTLLENPVCGTAPEPDPECVRVYTQCDLVRAFVSHVAKFVYPW